MESSHQPQEGNLDAREIIQSKKNNIATFSHEGNITATLHYFYIPFITESLKDAAAKTAASIFSAFFFFLSTEF